MAIKDLVPDGYDRLMEAFAQMRLPAKVSAQREIGGRISVWLSIYNAGQTMIGYGAPEEAIAEAEAALEAIKAQVRCDVHDLLRAATEANHVHDR